MVEDVYITPRPWKTSEPLFRGFSQLDLPRQSFVGEFSEHGKKNILISVLSQFRRDVVPHSGLSDFHSCALYGEVSHHGLIATISLPLALDLLFRSLPKIQDHR